MDFISPDSDYNLDVKLLNENLWQQFYSYGTEMILTKKGRHLFPTIEITVSGLELGSLYSIVLEFVQNSPKKFRFSKGRWCENGDAEAPGTRATYRHDHSPSPGEHWMKSAVSFRNLKITNSAEKRQCVMLNSLCSYHAQILILRVNGGEEVPVKAFSFPQTKFISVTAYQNANITQLKCKYNVFARRRSFSRKSKFDNQQKKLQNCNEDENEIAEWQHRFYPEGTQTGFGCTVETSENMPIFYQSSYQPHELKNFNATNITSLPQGFPNSDALEFDAADWSESKYRNLNYIIQDYARDEKAFDIPSIMQPFFQIQEIQVGETTNYQTRLMYRDISLY